MRNNLIVNFIFVGLDDWLKENNCKDVEDAEGGGWKDFIFSSGKEVWILKSYFILRSMNGQLSLTDRPVSGAINIIHREDFNSCFDKRFFIVCVRADREPAFRANHEIVQNQYSTFINKSSAVMHWLQGNIIPREKNNNGSIKVGYFGKDCHLHPYFQSNDFECFLKSNNIQLVKNYSRWNDYSQIDIALAFRDGFQFYLDCKPASKLINSWHAGVPIILNEEAGYIEAARGEESCIFIRSPSQAKSAILRLINDSDFYDSIVQIGRKNTGMYNDKNTMEQWGKLINSVLPLEFDKWNKSCRVLRNLRCFRAHIQELIWGRQITQYPDSPKRRLKSFIRVFFAAPLTSIKLFCEEGWP